MSCVIVTGGYGFIGSNFIKHLFDNTNDKRMISTVADSSTPSRISNMK